MICSDQGRPGGEEGAGRQAWRAECQGRANRDEARVRAEALRPIFMELAGKSSRAIAAELNARNVATPTGGRWHAQTVIRVQRRLEAAS